MAAYTNIREDMPPTPDGRPGHPAGSLAIVVTIAKSKQGHLVSFPRPSAAAMALNIAARAAQSAMELQGDIELIRDQDFFDFPTLTVSTSTVPKLYDYFEQCILAATSSFQALEAYCNLTIDREVENTIPWPNRDGITLDLTSLDLERQLSTEDKLGSLLPELLKMASPKGKKVWQDFKLLKQKRDASAHVKSNDQAPRPKVPNEVQVETLFSGFIGETVTDWPKAAVRMINYFDRRSVRWPWVQHELDRWGIPRGQES
jgi:hypothetical protein